MPNPKEKLVYEGSGDCTAIRIIHSNPLQENATYRADRRAPDSGKPIRITVEKQGHTVLPGDPITIKWRTSNHQRLVVEQDNPDSNYLGKFGKAYLDSDAEADYSSEESFPYCNWPVEIRFESDIDSYNKKELQYREQSAEYKPGLTDDEIKETPRFKSEYESWVRERDYNWRRDLGFPAGWENIHAPLEEYEIRNEQNRIISDLRLLYNTQWKPWTGLVAAYLHEYSGSYWTGGRDGNGQPTYENYYLNWTPEIELVGLFGSDGEEISYEGLSPHVLIAYEFVDEGGDFADFDDWDSILRVNFMGTPEPLTVECDDSNCPNHCIEIIRPEDKAWKCICSSDDLEPTPIADIPNRIERKRPPGAPDPPPKNLGQRKAQARDYRKKLQPKFDKAKAKYQKAGDTGEAAHKQHKEKDAIAKDPILSQSARDAAASESAQALRDRDEAMLDAKKAAEEMLEAKSGLDDLDEFLEDDPDDDSGISVGTALPPKPGWRPPLVMGGTGWNSTPTYINNNADKSTTQNLGPRGGIQAAQIQTPTVIGGGGFQDSQLQNPTIIGGNRFVAGEWNSTPTVIYETPGEIISKIISEE
jgi:hypothetical protein